MEAGVPGNVPGSGCYMALEVLTQVRQALRNLNPAEVREEAERPVRVGLVASSHSVLAQMESYFAPAELSPARRAQSAGILVRGTAQPADVRIYESYLLRPSDAFC